MTKSQRVPITLTPERQLMLDAIWQHLPHLKGSVSATLDYLGSLYLDPKTSLLAKESDSPAKELPNSTPTTEPVETPAVNPIDEW